MSQHVDVTLLRRGIDLESGMEFNWPVSFRRRLWNSNPQNYLNQQVATNRMTRGLLGTGNSCSWRRFGRDFAGFRMKHNISLRGGLGTDMNGPLLLCRAGATKMRRMRRLATVMCGKDHLLVATENGRFGTQGRQLEWPPKGNTWLWSGKGTQIKKQFKISTEMNMRNFFFSTCTKSIQTE